MLTLDESDFIVGALMENKPLAMSIFDDDFLSRYFWQEPTDKRASKSKKTKVDARTWYLQQLDVRAFLSVWIDHGADEDRVSCVIRH